MNLLEEIKNYLKDMELIYVIQLIFQPIKFQIKIKKKAEYDLKKQRKRKGRKKM